MPSKLPSIPGFTALSDAVLVREVEKPATTGQPAHETDPDTILIYGWGDGLPKHVAKYADGYRLLYPHAKQVVIISAISKTLFTDLEGRSGPMRTVLQATFSDDDDTRDHASRRILVHTMSNTGAVSYAATLNVYRQLYGRPLPHHLMVMDSTPGSTDMTYANLVRWSRAMALGTAAWFPWPFAVTQGIWAAFLGCNGCYEWAVGRESAGAWSRKAANDEAFEMKGARKLYLYSKEDDLIGWEDIVAHAAETRQLGWEADTEMFAGSGHVGHMRKAPEQYWKAIGDSWNRAVGDDA